METFNITEKKVKIKDLINGSNILLEELPSAVGDRRKDILEGLISIKSKLKNKPKKHIERVSEPISAIEKAILDCLEITIYENIEEKRGNLSKVISAYNEYSIKKNISNLPKNFVPRQHTKNKPVILFKEIVKAVFFDLPRDLRNFISKHLCNFNYDQLEQFITEPSLDKIVCKEKDMAFMTLVVTGFENLNQPKESN